MSSDDDTSSHVRVGVRIRPLTSKEISEGGKEVIDTNTFDRTVELSKRKFTYDSVFQSTIQNIQLYDNVSPPLLNAFLNGFNATVLAYGQTGSGKTYTMGSEAHTVNLRNEKLHDNDGLIPRFISEMFQSLMQRRQESEMALLQSSDSMDEKQPKIKSSLVDFDLTSSFLEVYGEDIYDLLVDETRTPLKLREGSNKEVVVKGLCQKRITNASDAMNVLSTGTMNRTTASTLMNRTSSRSHAVFMVNLRQTTRSAEGVDVTSTSRFTFVDLAGSERMKKTGAEGERAKEGIKINEGLLALGNVINALADEERLASGEKVHVPYRQSKLTRLLQDALGGNSQTLFLACVSPSDTNASETLSTLQYANRARNIKNAPTRNVDETAYELQRLHAWNNLLKRELVRLRFCADSSLHATEPEMERANRDIGLINDELLLREDVVAYLNMVDDKMSELGNAPNLPELGSNTKHFSSRTTNRPIVSSANEMSSSDDGGNDEGEEDSEISDSEINDDIQIIDDLIESRRQDQTPAAQEQIDNIDNEIETHEDRLLHLKEHLKGYQNMKEKYDHLLIEVENLEAEKLSLAKALEEAQVDPTKGCSVTIKKQLDQIKSSLERARSESRKHQQLYRQAEKEAQKCKVLEQKISQAKSHRIFLMKQQKEDAKKQKEMTKTKTREIQRLRMQERTAMKEVSKLKSENQRLRANLKRSKARCEKLSEQNKQTELSLNRVLTNRAKGNGTPRNHDVDCIGFAPMTEELSSLLFVLEKALENRVDLSYNKQMYGEKIVERGRLEQSMSSEVALLNEKKKALEDFGSEPPEDVVSAIGDCEENVQDLLLQIELIENDLEVIRDKHPAVEDDDDDRVDAFDSQDSALMILSKQNGPTLRSLVVQLLTSCHNSSLSCRRLKESKARDESTLNNLRNEIALKNEKIEALSNTLEVQQQNFLTSNEEKDNRYSETLSKKENDAKITSAQLDSCVAEKAGLLLELEKVRELLSLSQEREAKLEDKIATLESQLKCKKESPVMKRDEEVERRVPNELNRDDREHPKGYVFVETDSVTTAREVQHSSTSSTTNPPNPKGVKKLVELYSGATKETLNSPKRPLNKTLKHTFRGVIHRNK